MDSASFQIALLQFSLIVNFYPSQISALILRRLNALTKLVYDSVGKENFLDVQRQYIAQSQSALQLFLAFLYVKNCYFF